MKCLQGPTKLELNDHRVTFESSRSSSNAATVSSSLARSAVRLVLGCTQPGVRLLFVVELLLQVENFCRAVSNDRLELVSLALGLEKRIQQ